MQPTYTPAVLWGIIARLESGQSVITSNQSLDAISDLLKDDESERAARFFRNVITLPNPNRLGLLDVYITSYAELAPTGGPEMSPSQFDPQHSA